MMNDKLNEILDILIEECSEVIQAASKVKRFGEFARFRVWKWNRDFL